MKSKTEKNYIYEGLGFPVLLSQVKMLFIQDEWHPKLNVKKIADLTIKKLIGQNGRLTGNQIKFIRTYFAMSLRDFANVMEVTHTAVNKWEKTKNSVTNMDINTEKMLRLYVVITLYKQKNKEQEKALYQEYIGLQNISSQSKLISNVQIDY